MKERIVTFICRGALLLSPLCSRAMPYELQCSLVSSNHKNLGGHRSSKRPLVVDLNGHTLSVPNQIVGYTITLKSESGELYTYYLTDTIFELPHEFSGLYKLTLSNDDMGYEGFVQIIN